ncbi:MAG: sensor domain-containing diguanylate cyclase [Acidobacteria bacterium]|nr:sensor domain-containing diguanylate cyclase [Acidobacteriota bacterium]
MQPHRQGEFSFSQELRYRALHRLALSLRVESSPDRLLRCARAALQKVLEFQAAILLLPTGTRGRLELAAHVGLTPRKAATLRRKLAAVENLSGIPHHLQRRKLPWVWPKTAPSPAHSSAVPTVALPGYRSLLFLPLPGSQRIVGLLVLYHPQPWDQHKDSLAFYQEIAQLLAIGVEITGRYIEQKRRRVELEKLLPQQRSQKVHPSDKTSAQTLEDIRFLYNLSEAIKYSAAEDRVYGVFLRKLSAGLRMRQAVIATCAGSPARLRVRASLKPLPVASVREMRVEDCPAVASERPRRAKNQGCAAPCPCQWLHSRQGGVYCTPLFSNGTVFGILQVEAKSGYWTETRKRLLNEAAALLAAEIQNTRTLETIRHRSMIDNLTRLFNRGFFEEYLTKELQRSQRTGQSFGLLMVDVDHFKQINDTYGHAAGDAVLQQVGQQFRQRLRSSNLVARYGGDEFTVVLCNINRDRALQVAERLRLAAQELSLPEPPRNGLRISTSIGLALFPENGTSGTELYQAADQALYEAKRQGRNKVVAAPKPPNFLAEASRAF